MEKIIRTLTEALTKDWGLKLLAIALAIVLYYSVKPTDTFKVNFSGNNNERIIFKAQ